MPYVRPPLPRQVFVDADGTRFPADPEAAPMTFLWTDYPGVMAEAGVLLHAHVPGCGCDACDSSVADEARELEEIALGVPEGRLREWVRRALPGGATWIGHALETPDRVSSSDGRANLPRDVVRAARRRLAALPDGVWRPWPRR